MTDIQPAASLANNARTRPALAVTAKAVPTRHNLSKHLRVAITSELTVLFDRVDVLLARLDDADGDIDLEEDDPSGDPLELNGEALDDEARGILPIRPFYGVDQTAGPNNYAEAQSAYLAAANGLVRTASGGWGVAA